MAKSTITKATTRVQYAYPFGAGLPTPAVDRNLLGGKGKGLVDMVSIGIPVPPGFIITTEACNSFRNGESLLPAGLKEEIFAAMKVLETVMKAQFGSDSNPLLVSVRSGARVSMPGMMDTVLNLGLNDRSVQAFAKATNNERLAYDNYCRLIRMYGEIVQGISRKHFDEAMQMITSEEGVRQEIDLNCQGLKRACNLFQKIFAQYGGVPFPQDPKEQLLAAINAVFNSWEGERATLYRQINQIPDEWGTAVIVQAMVFGNRGERSATGVAFTRNPSTGEKFRYGEFLPHAQGEEVVAGTRTPQPINSQQKLITKSTLGSLEELMPEVYQQLSTIMEQLEKHYKDMQDIEFTIDDGRLFLLQTRTGKRTGFAAFRLAVEMLHEGLIDKKTALLRVRAEHLIQLLAPIFDLQAKDRAKSKLVGKGLNASPGAASGKVALSPETAQKFRQQGIKCILVRAEANPDDFPGMVAAEGVLTTRGGSTSHAAVVARGMGKPCVVGCEALLINEDTKTISANGLKIKEGDPLSIDGTTGEVFFTAIETSPSEVIQVVINKSRKAKDSQWYSYYQEIMELASAVKTLEVRANADSPLDSHVAKAFGATGVGLCRTEHMFMNPKRLIDVRRMFFSTNAEERKASIARLLEHQTSDFIGIFEEMDGLPVTIRLLDPPLHEFMPHTSEEIHSLAQAMGVSAERLIEIRAALQEQNPMLGHRGCRLGIVHPDVTGMQARAIFEAAIQVAKEGKIVHPEIMVPLVGIESELIHQKAIIDATAAAVFKEKGIKIDYSVGTMIELPRAALIADKIARHASFFSFGTNDLTQTTFGISRDDSAKFVPTYVKGVPQPEQPGTTVRLLTHDPFEVLDREGVGELMELAVSRGRKTRPDLKCGICGEHGGDPQSIAFCLELGLDYVSCSPYRVPIAKLAAAHAALEQKK